MWDKDTALVRLMGNRDLFKQICQIFLARSPEQMTALKQYVTNLDCDNIRKQSHALKGACGDLGANELHGIYYQLECLAQQKNSQDIPALFAKAQLSYDEFIAQVLDYLA